MDTPLTIRPYLEANPQRPDRPHAVLLCDDCAPMFDDVTPTPNAALPPELRCGVCCRYGVPAPFPDGP